MDNYLQTTNDLYRKAALEPQVGLCCTTSPVWQLPGLHIPRSMLEMNYGCGSTVHPGDLTENSRVLYIGIGGGMELLQFAYFTRQEESAIGVDVLDEMLDATRKNLKEAEQVNSWFRENMIAVKKGDALSLPVPDQSVDVVAQNCLFNIFKHEDLKKALSEVYRVLKPGGRLVLSDPVCDQHIPDELRSNSELRAQCLSGSLSVSEYIDLITSTGFGTVEVRARRPYRILDSIRFPQLSENVYIESLEVCAIKDPMPEDGPCVFTGKTAIYFGNENYFDDGKGHTLLYNQPLAVCDKTAEALASLKKEDLFVTNSTWFYDGGGCC